MEAFMIVQRGEDIGRRFDIDTTQLTIGRGSDNDLALNDPMVSRYHAVVKRQGSRYSLIDLGSSNPVVVNDQVLEPGSAQQLNHRDVIFIGKTVFSFQNRAAGAAQPSRPTTNPTPRSDVAATQLGGAREIDPPTPPPATRANHGPLPGQGAGDDKTMIAPPPAPTQGKDDDNEKTQIVGAERGTPPAPPALFSSPPAPVDFDDNETRTSIGAPPPPPAFAPPPPPPADKMVGTPPNEEDGDLPTQIIPRR